MLRKRLRQSRHVVLVAMVACACSSATDPPTVGDPSAPSALVAAPLGGGVHLTWKDNSSDEEAFEIERREGSSPFQRIDSVPFNMTLYHDSAVTPGKQYGYRVRAKLAMGFSAYSNEATVDLSVEGAGGMGGTLGGGSGTGGTGGQAGASDGGGMNGAGASGSGTGATGGQAGTAGDGATSNPDAGSKLVVSFRSDIVPILAQGCGSTTAGCHNSDQAVGRIMPQFGPCKVIWFSAVDEPIGATYISGPNQGQCKRASRSAGSHASRARGCAGFGGSVSC